MGASHAKAPSPNASFENLGAGAAGTAASIKPQPQTCSVLGDPAIGLTAEEARQLEILREGDEVAADSVRGPAIEANSLDAGAHIASTTATSAVAAWTIEWLFS